MSIQLLMSEMHLLNLPPQFFLSLPLKTSTYILCYHLRECNNQKEVFLLSLAMRKLECFIIFTHFGNIPSNSLWTTMKLPFLLS